VTEGERWARERLEELRAARFAPRAGARFIALSLERSRERRREHRRARRELAALAVAGSAAWGGAALAGHPAPALAGEAWWLLVLLMADWHLGMLEDADGRPLPGLGPATALSLARAGLAPALLAAAATPAGLALLGAAVATDLVDGPLARRRGEVSRLGDWLDGAADGVVLVAATAGAVIAGELPAWAAALVGLRHGLPWALAAGVYFARAEAPPRDRLVSGRLPGAVLAAGLALAFAGLPGAAAAVAIGAIGGIGTLALTVIRSVAAGEPPARTAEAVPPRSAGG